MPDNSRDHESEASEAPPALVAALKSSPQVPIFVPPAVDESILRTAQRHLLTEKKPLFNWTCWLRRGLAMAALVLLFSISFQLLRNASPRNPNQMVQGDFHPNQPVDILDAFALARQLKVGNHPDLKWDFNGDGVVDERDVAALAARAVSLAKGGRS